MNLDQINRDSDPHNVQYLLSVLRESTGGGGEGEAGSIHDHAMGAASLSSSTASPYSPAVHTESAASARSTDPRKRRPVAAESVLAPEQRGAEASTSSRGTLPSTDLGSRASTSSTLLSPSSQSQPQPRSILKGSASPLSPAPPAAAASVSTSSPPVEDLSHLSSTAPQTLPHLKRLASSVLFLRALMTLKREQDELERALQREWGRLEERHKMVGTGGGAGGKGGGGGGAAALEKEKERWKERALQRWDTVAERQQVRLKELNTPGFYPTKSPAARANQRKILDLISGLIESG